MDTISQLRVLSTETGTFPAFTRIHEPLGQAPNKGGDCEGGGGGGNNVFLFRLNWEAKLTFVAERDWNILTIYGRHLRRREEGERRDRDQMSCLVESREDGRGVTAPQPPFSS